MGEYVSMVMEEAPIGTEEIQQASEADALISSIIKRVVTSAWRDCNPVEEPYHRVRDKLTVANGVLLLGKPICHSRSDPPLCTRLAHEGHPGMDAFLDTLKTCKSLVARTDKRCHNFRGMYDVAYVGDDTATIRDRGSLEQFSRGFGDN